MADAFHGRHLLLVGDGSRLAGSLARSLQEQGSRVDQAHSLAAARCCLRSAAYDLLLLDAMLPDGDGLAFLGELRGSGNHVPVLVLATHIVTAEVVHGLRSGADDCLGRPFALDELLLRVAALLRRQAWTEPPVAAVRNAAFGGNRVDLATGLAETPHGRLRLSETELRLLRYFIAHRDEDLPRGRLLAEVWGLAVADGASSRTLDTFVLGLRRHLERDPAEPVHFRTVHGIGYRFHPGPGGAFTA